jgi:hypothetical protein
VDTQMTITLPLSTGQSLPVEFSARGDLIHVRYGAHCAAVLDRDRLGRWFARPRGEWTTDEVTFVDAGARVALMLHGVGLWWLSTGEVAALRATV